MADLDCGIVSTNSSSSTFKKPQICDEEKLTVVLKKILQESYKFSDDTILDKLYLHLSKQAKEGEFINKDDVLIPWLSLVIKKWDKLKTNIKTYGLKMAGVVCTTPEGLKQLISKGYLTEIKLLARNDTDISITLAFVELLSEVVNHVQGCIWFIEAGLQEHVLTLLYAGRSIYITRKTQELVINLVVSLYKFDIESCWSVIDGIILPLNLIKLNKDVMTRQDMLASAQNYIVPFGNLEGNGDVKYDANEENDLINDKEFTSMYNNERIVPTVRLLCSLLDALVNSNCSANNINLIFKHYNLYLWAWERLYMERYNDQVISCVSSLITYLNFSTIPRNEKKLVPESDLIDTLKSLLYLAQSLAHKRQYLVVNNICVLSQMLTEKLISSTMFLSKEDGVTYNFRAQILSLHALPIFIFVKLARLSHTDVTDKFADKLFNLICVQVKRVCYQYRDTLRSCPEDYNTELWLRSSIQTLSGILKYLHKEQVVVVFQSFMHLLREFVPDEYTNMTDIVTVDKFELVQKYPSLLMAILDGIEITIRNYNITWSESLETVCVLVLLMSLSCISNLSIPLSTKLLKLIEISISSFIPPNLALLVENIKDSSLENLGSLLLRKLGDVNWEIRDSALEILQTLASLSEFKFPAFQNILLDTDFPSVVIGMVECDQESYVRASAIMCLQKMVQVKRLWEEALADKKLLEKMLGCLKTEPEGLVRKEAVSLITAIFINHEISESLTEQVQKQLFLVANNDLHWEVKVSALSFWDAVIDYETAYQGMIDGAFPAVTFSQKSRKIVNLTPLEIQKRLKLVLDELQKNGCLQVLWAALNDTSDLEVARKSVSIISRLLQLLQQYGVVEETCGRATVIPSLSGSIITKASTITNSNDDNDCKDDEMESISNGCNGSVESCSASSSSGMSSQRMAYVDDVITSILDSQDIELLSGVYCKDGNKIIHDEPDKDEAFLRDLITVDEFVERVSTLNLESIIKARSDWLKAADDLDSLMDDILAVAIDDPDDGEDKVNSKDCY